MKAKQLYTLIMSLIVGLLVSINQANANNLTAEINHLLKFIESSPCQFMRNGRQYSAKEALEHIKNKYEYFKSDINSAEQFIEKSASKSTMSGKLYTVTCPNQSITSRQWLLRSLSEYRNQIK